MPRQYARADLIAIRDTSVLPQLNLSPLPIVAATLSNSKFTGMQSQNGPKTSNKRPRNKQLINVNAEVQPSIASSVSNEVAINVARIPASEGGMQELHMLDSAVDTANNDLMGSPGTALVSETKASTTVFSSSTKHPLVAAADALLIAYLQATH